MCCLRRDRPFAAALIDRFGTRRTLTASMSATALGVALTPAMSEPWQLVLLWGVVVGIGCGFTGAYLAPLIASRWFKERQGLVIGLLTAGNAAGQLVFLPTMASLATSAGWRAMSLTLGVCVLRLCPVLLADARPPGFDRAGVPMARRPPPRRNRPVPPATRSRSASARSATVSGRAISG